MASTRFHRDAPPSDLAAVGARLELERDEALRERDEARAELLRRERRTPAPRSVLAADWLYRALALFAAVAAVLLVATLVGAIL